MVYFGLHQHARKGTTLDAQQTFFLYMDLLCVKLKDTAVFFLMEALKMEVFKKNKIKLM